MSEVHTQDGLPAFQIGQFHLDAPVKASGAQQGLVQCLRPVGGSQNHNTLAAVKTIHLRQQLIQGLFALIIPREAVVALLSDGINLINKNNAGGLFIGLLEQVAHLGRSHSDKHLDKLRTGYGKKRHFGLTGHGTGYQGLSRSRRAHQQSALGKRGTNLGIFLGIMQKIHNLTEHILGFVLPGHIGKGGLHIGIGIDFGTAVAERHEISSRAETVLNAFAGLSPDQIKN